MCRASGAQGTGLNAGSVVAEVRECERVRYEGGHQDREGCMSFELETGLSLVAK